MNREELEEVFNRVYVGQYRKNERKKVDGSKTLDRNYFSRHRRVSKIAKSSNLHFDIRVQCAQAKRGKFWKAPSAFLIDFSANSFL